MNVYDTANRLAEELKKSEEYANYKMAKETLNINHELKNKIKEFEEARYDAQITAMQTGKNDEEKVKQAVLHFKENYHIIEEKPTKPIMIREVLS